MFRRRRPLRRRRLIRAATTPPLGARPRQMLANAHRLLDNGEYLAAADIFEKLANGALNRNMVKRAPNLFIQAARANFLAKKADHGEELLMQGLKILAEQEMWPALNKMGNIAVTELRKQEYEDIAQKVKDWLDKQLAGKSVEQLTPASAKGRMGKSHIPAKCPYCGASLRPDEYDWLDQMTVECPYCGSVVNSDE